VGEPFLQASQVCRKVGHTPHLVVDELIQAGAQLSWQVWSILESVNKTSHVLYYEVIAGEDYFFCSIWLN
jgi:hypothetical protein